MQIQILFWAGIKIVAAGITLVIDLLENTAPLNSLLGEPRTKLFKLEREGGVQMALVTHLHPDHYDPVALRRRLAPGGKVVCHTDVHAKISAHGLPVHALGLEEPFTHEGVSMTPVPAVDGFGDSQVSWVVESDGKKIIHCGDTLWHGHWWKIRQKHGPFDAAFLPINGAVTRFPGMEPSGLPGALTPEQAAAAGRILSAKAVVPIHYGTFNNPPIYAEVPNAEEEFLAAAQERRIPVRVVRTGDTFPWKD